MSVLARTRRVGWLAALAGLGLAAAGFVLLAGTASSDSSITVTRGDFTLTCPTNTVAEGGTLECTLANTSPEARPWPVVAIMHLSTDEDHALVRGTLIDAAFGARSPAAQLDNGAWWIGETLVGYSRFDWPGTAGADPAATTTTAATPAHSRTVSVVANQDDLLEGSEAFYVALGPDGSRGVGLLYNNRHRVTITDNDAASSDISLSSLKLTAARNHTLSATQASQTVTVAYRVTEATLTAEAARGATMALSASYGGDAIDLDGRGGTALAVAGGEASAAVPLGVGVTAVTLTVTAEDGTAGTHEINVVRRDLGAATTVAVSSGAFTLTCPAQVGRATVAECTLTNTRSGPAPWPVVAVIHSSADDLRALVAEDPIIPDTDPAYSKDLSLGTQQPARESFNYGYGELFSGGSRSVYRTYGYEKFDWTGNAPAGASRPVAIELHDDLDTGAETEVFYAAVAPSGYTGLSRLIDNKVPVLLEGVEPPNEVLISASPASPVVGQVVTLSAYVSNAPAGRAPSYSWELNYGGGWSQFGSDSTFSYLAAFAETTSFRVTVTYGLRVSATSDPLTITFAAPAPDPPARPGYLEVETTAGDLNLVADWESAERASIYTVRWRRPQSGFDNDGIRTADTSARITMPGYGTWVIRVEGCNDGGCGLGAAQTVVIDLVSSKTPRDLAVSSAPEDLGVIAHWEAAAGATSYRLRWRRAGDGFQPDDQVTTTSTEATFTVSSAGTWVIRVEGCNDDGCGPPAVQTFEVPEP